ncbi:probable L-type lectin-domain containing receptor kinase S.7 [Telopea speciosissima]|uniref:probable L-type lectin-domain containing receptor kinase S.7 n=1 Tax=Telopea speciosissima TaxID=54955 RepID=UPI001CC5AD84|nr:probable L-type lectin-domain containing receptor kinase S.7 [Telopea speciosissima]
MARKARLTMSSTTPGKIILFLSLFVFFYKFSTVPIAVAENVRFDFSSFGIRNLTLLGDSYLRDGVVGLTRELSVPTSSSGSVICNLPISFFDPETNSSASFSTRFSFAITNVSPSSYGDGLAFFLSPDNQTLGSPGGFLGLVNSSQMTKNSFVAVEFDTRLDPQFNDPSNNHIGLDINSLNSIKVEDPTLSGIDLKSGNWITAWIDYKDDQKKLNVWMNYSSSKPEKPMLSVDIDLSKYLAETMYAGFSASTEGSTEVHLIKEWTFQTFGFQPVKPHSPPQNESDNSKTYGIPIIPISNSTNKTQKNLGLGLGIPGTALFFVVGMVFGWITVRKWNIIGTDASFKQELLKGPREFGYREIKAATKGFCPSRVLGHGAFGTVYKACFLGSGTISAVKRSKHSHECLTEFRAELSIIASLRHRNLVQLQGWCAEKGELLLVYEFMPNGSLDSILYQEPDEGVSLNWSQRYNIALGIGSVLAYLHQECEQQVIHRDIKTSNILLDGNFNPRLGDFGLARLMEHDKSPVSSLTAGTMGYLAPEYLQYGKATEKTDVFSFGVVILEVACGRRPIEKDVNNHKVVNLVDWVWGLHSKDNLNEAADKRLNGEFKEEEMRKLLLVGLSCANPDCKDRPSMRRVFQILNGEAELPLVPKMKPSITFSSSLLLSLEDIISESEESKAPSRLNEIIIN